MLESKPSGRPGGSVAAERWRRIDEVFAAALECPASRRRAMVESACGGDQALLERVEALLAADEKAESFLEPAATPVFASRSLVADVQAPADGRVGPYRLLRILGSGGMGTVYLAARDDDVYRRLVALKLMRHSADNEEIARRFVAERQILASLEHPNIARLYDGGTSEDGRPFLVMELVDGEPIDRFCNRHRLTIEARLILFQQVCAAVQYAHRNLLVHRDLKPDNILVSADGVPKLLDFGIAKLLRSAERPEALRTTRTGVRLMTLTYASPEQIRGQAVTTTASDIYSLGVLLFELLTGRCPYRLADDSPYELERAICEQEPERPSIAVLRASPPSAGAEEASGPAFQAAQLRPRELSRRLRGDLDTLVLKAMHKEPPRRYESVGQFAADIRRHLELRPIAARLDSLTYRAGRFVRRQRLLVGAASLVVVLVAAFVIALLDQRGLAKRKQLEAQQALRFLVGLFQGANVEEGYGKDATAREIVARGAGRIDRELADQPEVRATLLDAVGQVYAGLGFYDEARSYLERAYELRRQLFGEEHAEVARSLQSLALAVAQQGHDKEAEALYERTLALRRELLGDHPETAEALNELGSLLRRKGDYDRAEAMHREAVAIQHQLLSSDDPELATTLNHLALTVFLKGEPARAEAMLRDALAIQRRSLDAQHPAIVETLRNSGRILSQLGRYDQAEAVLREALTIADTSYENDHPMRFEVVNSLARVLKEKGELSEAEALFRQAVAALRDRLGDGHPKVALGLNNLAGVLFQRGERAEVVRLHREALEIRRQALGEDHIQVAWSLCNLAESLRAMGDLVAAGPLFRRAHEILEAQLGGEDLTVAYPLIGLGNLLMDQGEYLRAIEKFEQGLEIRRRILPPGHWQIASAEGKIGACLTALGRFEEAETWLLDSYSSASAGFEAGHPRIAVTLERLVELYRAWGKPMISDRYVAMLDQPRAETD
ncbi:MAG: serine/threonine protein kinase [bacterium]|nr:serine/threonine protein kinase [bacterium]